MSEEYLEGETRGREEAEARIRVATEALERATQKAEQREFKEAPRRVEEGERPEVQRIVAERRIEALERIEAKSLEADLGKDSKLQQEAEIRRPKVDTTEEGKGYGTGASGEEEARDEDNKKYGNEGTTTSGEEINGLDEDAERDDNVSNGDEDVNRDAVQSSGGSEADEWESGGSDGDKDEESLEAEEMEEVTEE